MRNAQGSPRVFPAGTPVLVVCFKGRSGWKVYDRDTSASAMHRTFAHVARRYTHAELLSWTPDRDTPVDEFDRLSWNEKSNLLS